jgi:predicted HTH domain antitoxin
MKTTPYPLRLPKNILELADLMASEEHIERSAALRKLLYAGGEEYVIGLLERGRISLSKAAELLDCSTLAIYHLAEERGIALGASAEEYERAKDGTAAL